MPHPMCTSNPHPTGGGMTMGARVMGPFRGGSYGHLHSPPHIPQGGGGITSGPSPWGGTTGIQDMSQVLGFATPPLPPMVRSPWLGGPANGKIKQKR